MYFCSWNARLESVICVPKDLLAFCEFKIALLNCRYKD